MEDYKSLLLETVIKENKNYNYEILFKNKIKKYSNKKDKDFLKFLWDKRKSGITLARLNKYCDTYNKFLKEKYNKLSKIKEKDVEIIYIRILKCNNTNSSKRTHLNILKQIVSFYNDKINLSKYKIKEEKKPLMSEELLTEDEKHKIISEIKGLQHKVFFTILFDTGIRVGELFSIDKTCFQKVEKGYIITIKESKTQIRSVFTYSHNYLIEKLLKSKWETWTFGHRTAYNIIKRFEKKLNKRLYLHLARHTKATELAQCLTEQEIKSYMGWSPDSKMLKTYIHLNNKLVIDKLQKLI